MNLWEEQFYLGGDDGVRVNYGLAIDGAEAFRDRLRRQIVAIGQRKWRGKGSVARRTIERLLRGDAIRPGILMRIWHALAAK